MLSEAVDVVSRPAQSNSPWLDDDKIALNVTDIDGAKRRGHGFVQSVDRDFVWKPNDDDAVVAAEGESQDICKANVRSEDCPTLINSVG